MNYLLWLGFWIIVAVIVDLRSNRKHRLPPPPAPPAQPYQPTFGPPGRYVHKGNYHNRYWTSGNLNKIAPWENHKR
jgi:hypothetical protein